MLAVHFTTVRHCNTENALLLISIIINKTALAINKFSDLTTEEFSQSYNGWKPSPPAELSSTLSEKQQQQQDLLNCGTHEPVNVILPDIVDWRERNVISQIKDQDNPPHNFCGSCYAFSAVGALEAQNALLTGKLVQFSEQNLVDCSKPEGNSGCDGGSMNLAFEYVKKNGLSRNSTYPYVGNDEDQCHYDAQTQNALRPLLSCNSIAAGNEQDLTNAIANVGPISVCIDASQDTYKSYAFGVYDEPKCSSSELNHGVLAIGYGEFQGKQYYLIKNSLGESWGDKGYMLLARNKNNQCGIASVASYPILS